MKKNRRAWAKIFSFFLPQLTDEVKYEDGCPLSYNGLGLKEMADKSRKLSMENGTQIQVTNGIKNDAPTISFKLSLYADSFFIAGRKTQIIMALARPTPTCPYCGKATGKGIYKDESDVSRFMRLIGDTFLRWEHKECSCKGAKKARKEHKKAMEKLHKEHPIDWKKMFEGKAGGKK